MAFFYLLPSQVYAMSLNPLLSPGTPTLLPASLSPSSTAPFPAAEPFDQHMTDTIDATLSRSLGSLVGDDVDAGDDDTSNANAGSALPFANPQSSAGTQTYAVPQHVGGMIAPPAAADSSVTWNGGTLNESELQITAVLDRHKDQCPLSWDSLNDKINDASTPPDLKAALQGLQHDPRLFFAISSQGDGRSGGKIKAKDLTEFSANHPQVAAFNEQKAAAYTQNYIPSDGSGNRQPRAMTESDALRELYRYSDNLPKHLGTDDFKQIVDGDAKTGKTPPQVIASAQYFLDHQDAWNKLSGSDDRISKEDFLQTASSSMSLTQNELDTLAAMNHNQSAFFGDGDLTRDKLTTMCNDKHLDAKTRDAAKQLLRDPLLFGLLNNTITGYKTHHGAFDFGGGHTVDSGNISNRDFNHFYDNMSAANRTVEKQRTHAATAPEQQDAVADMMMGRADQPEIKSPKHNGGFLEHALNDVLKVGAKALDWAATAMSALSFIPGIGELADIGSAVLESEAQAANILHTVISGGNIKKALAEAGLSLAAQAVGDIAGPEAKIAMRNGLAKKLVEKAANASIDLGMSEAKSYTEDYLNNLKARIEAGPLPRTGMQNAEYAGA
ncbi:MAG TPA: HrpF/NolX family T3SS translocon protein [Paraburkholderia sp.]|nr:HrpF/NolX family T3SS translocon protein [Paraburkholderia sp.]